MTNTNTPLHIAVQNGNAEIVKILLASDCDVNARNADGLTPLDLATMANNTEIVALLIADRRSKDGMSSSKETLIAPLPVSSVSSTTTASHRDSPPKPLLETSIMIERKWGFSDFFYAYAVFVDGIEIGAVKPGFSELPVSPGRHVMILKTKGFGKQAHPTADSKWILGSKEIDVTVAHGEHVSFFVKNAFSFLNWKLLVFNMYYYLLYDPSGWIIVEKR